MDRTGGWVGGWAGSSPSLALAVSFFLKELEKKNPKKDGKPRNPLLLLMSSSLLSRAFVFLLLSCHIIS